MNVLVGTYVKDVLFKGKWGPQLSVGNAFQLQWRPWMLDLNDDLARTSLLSYSVLPSE